MLVALSFSLDKTQEPTKDGCDSRRDSSLSAEFKPFEAHYEQFVGTFNLDAGISVPGLPHLYRKFNDGDPELLLGQEVWI